MNALSEICTHLKTFRICMILVAASFLAGCGGGGGSTSSAPPPPPPPSYVTTIALTAKHMVYDGTRQRLYASVSSADATHPNTVAIINPATGAIESAIAVGSNPDQLALSADGQYLYVGIDGTGSVSRIDLGTATVGLTFSLGVDPTWHQTRIAGSMSIMPGNSSTIAVDMLTPMVSPPYSGIAIFDNGVPRPNALDSRTGWSDLIAFSDSGSTLYGGGTSVSGADFARYAVNASGITVGDTTTGVFGGSEMNYASGRIYMTSGEVLDPVAMAVVGTLGAGYAQSATVDVSSGHAYFLLNPGTYSTPSILQYDLGSYLESGSMSVTAPGAQLCRNLVKAGSTGFAFIGDAWGSFPASVVITKQTFTAVPDTNPTLAKLQVNHIVYDATRQKIYASVPSSMGSKGNSIAVIDPRSSTITSFIPVGSEPNVLALSDGGTYLYVGLDGSLSVARLNLNTQTVEQNFQLAIDSSFGPRKASSIAAMPGSPKSFAVAAIWAAAYSPREAGAFVVDDNVQRPNSVIGTQGSDVIAFGSSSSVLYGFGGLEGFQRFNIDSSGISLGQQSTSLIWHSPVQLQAHGNLVYASDGTVIDPAQMRSAGLFAATNTRGFVLDDATSGAYFLADDRAANQGNSALFAFDQSTLVYRGKMTLPASWGQGFDLLGCGTGCFAYATSPGVTVVAANISTASAPAVTSLPVNHLLYDATRNKIYAAVSGAVAALGNSIVIIDPATKSITGNIYVGSEPDPMAISSDGSRLYVGLDGTALVAEVDLVGKSVTSTTWMGQDPLFGALFAYYLSVSPDDPEVVAVTRRRSWAWSSLANGVSVIDHGSLLNKNTDSSLDTIDSLAYAPGGNIYAYDNETSGFEFYRLLNDGTGVTKTDSQGRLIYGFFAGIQYDSGLIYSSNGYVVDPVADTTIGMFNGAGCYQCGLSLALDDVNSKAYFLAYDASKSTSAIFGFDKKTMVSLGIATVPGTSGRGFDLVHHSAGLAYATADGQIIFTSPSFAAPVDLPLSQLPANRIVYDPTRQRIYAAIPSRGGLRGNSIAIINPATGSVESSIAVGSEPGPLALSQDGQYLYVGLEGAAYVKRVNISTQQVDLQFTLGSDSFLGPKFAEDIAVMPGNSDVVAVAKMYTTIIPPKAGIGIFQHGVERANSLYERDASNSITFSATPDTLYGYVNDETTFTLNQMQVDANGVTLASSNGGLISGVARIQFDSGLIYSTTGNVVDPVSKTVAGTFAGVGVADSMVIDDTLRRVYFLTHDSISKSVSISSYDKSSYRALGTQTVVGATAQGTDLARWGSSGFAVSTGNEIILIATSSLAQ